MFIRNAVVVSAVAAGICSCSINKLAINSMANALGAEGSTVFTGEDDPQLVGDALPFALKLYESLLEKAPDNIQLNLATGKAFSMYAYAYVQTPAEQLGNDELERKKEMLFRAKKLYLRSRVYLLSALDIRYPGLKKQVEAGLIDSALARTCAADTTLLYWTGISWVGAIMTDKFDFEMLLTLKQAVACIERVAALNEHFGSGAVNEFYISYYGALPAAMGGDEQKARSNFEAAVAASQGKSAAPFVALASTVSVKNQNVSEFRDLLHTACSIDVSERSPGRLANIIAANKARWLLDHVEEYFLIDDTTTDSLPSEQEN